MGNGRRILIVDDNLRARKALSACLSTLDGCQVVGEACNGQDALLEVERHAPDTVLMDAQMPVMDGLAATQAIKERWPEIRVIILTLYAEYRSRAQQTGADAFLVKGCSLEEIPG
jgi:DNA-binding NarL/FixJ family response regulator